MQQKLKMLYILNIANRVNNFSQASMVTAQKMGIEFHIAGNWAYSSQDELKEDEFKYGIKIHQIDFIREPYNLKNIKAYNQLKRLVKSEGYDIIHSNTPIGGVLGRLVGRACKVKINIYQAHGFHFYKGAPKKNWFIYYPIEKLLARYTDALITINQEDYEISKSKFKLRNNGKVYYVPGVGIDLKQYQTDSFESIRTKLRSELGLRASDVVLISVGRLDKNKNISTLIKAVALCNNPYIHLVVCGDGEEKKVLLNLTSDLRLRMQIHFLGNRSDMNELYAMADILVMTSYREGLSRSIMEAMASGLPIACSRIRGNTDLIDEGKGGVLFDPQNIDEIASTLNTLLVSDMKSMGKYNLDKIKGFSLDTVIEKMTEVYRKELLKD